MTKKNLLFLSLVLMLTSGLCACNKVGGIETVSAETSVVDAGAAPVQTVSIETEASTRTTTVPNEDDPTACPKGMREVSGEYCRSVEHRCLKGRDVVYSKDPKNPGGLLVQTIVPWSCANPNGCAVPQYCDVFVKGYAVCGTKDDAHANGGPNKVPDVKPMHFCIDDGEYPNVAKEMPRVQVTWNEASSLCEAQNKRLCGDDEWTLACEGPKRLPYSYGWERDASKCYIDHRKSDGPMPVLSSPQCTSPYGVHDMNGNVDEWTRNVTLGGKPYESIFKGGHWVEGARDRCRPNTSSHGPTFSFYAEGFRCCADPATVTR